MASSKEDLVCSGPQALFSLSTKTAAAGACRAAADVGGRMIGEEAAVIVTVREELHRILDHIPESDVSTARKFLRSLVDPVELSLLNAPVDEEPESEDEREAVERARRETGRGTPHEEVLRELGL
jgi:hypothetical protein